MFRIDNIVKDATMKCECNQGKITVQGRVFEADGWSDEPPMELTCPWCDGTGEMTPAQVEEKQAYIDAWCKCGNPSGQANYYQHGHAHGYTCADCGKIVQTG